MGVPYGELVGGWPTPWKKGVRWVRQIGSSQLLGNIKNVPKHQPGRVFASQNLMLGCCGYDRLWARYFVKIVWCYVGSEQTICEVVLTGNKSMVRQGTEWYARTPGWLPGPCSWNPWRKRFNQRPLGKVMTFGIRWSCSLTKSLFCGWTPRSVAGYGWLNPTIYIYIYCSYSQNKYHTHTFPSCHIDTCRDHTCFCRQKSHAHISTFSPTSEILAGRIATFA